MGIPQLLSQYFIANTNSILTNGRGDTSIQIFRQMLFISYTYKCISMWAFGVSLLGDVTNNARLLTFYEFEFNPLKITPVSYITKKKTLESYIMTGKPSTAIKLHKHSHSTYAIYTNVKDTISQIKSWNVKQAIIIYNCQCKTESHITWTMKWCYDLYGVISSASEFAWWRHK